MIFFGVVHFYEIFLYLTFLPASLLCKFINGWALFGFLRLRRRSLASTKFRENVMPKSTLSLHPDHCKKIATY